MGNSKLNLKKMSKDSAPAKVSSLRLQKSIESTKKHMQEQTLVVERKKAKKGGKKSAEAVRVAKLEKDYEKLKERFEKLKAQKKAPAKKASAKKTVKKVQESKTF